MPGAASEENLTVGANNRRVAAKQSGVWMIAKDIHCRLNVIWQECIIAVDEHYQLSARESYTIVTCDRGAAVLWLFMHADKRIIGLRLEPGDRAVSRTIVDYDRLDLRIGLRLDRVETDRNPSQSVEGGNDDCY